MTKSFLKSKTIWFGILQVVLGLFGLWAGTLDTQSATTLIVTGVGSISLRLSTTTAIKGF